MAVEAERLLINVEARINQLEREMRKGRNTADRELGAIEKRAGTMARNVNQRFVNMARGAAAGLAGAFTIRTAGQFIDSATRVENALKVVGLEGKALTQVYGQLYAAAQRNAAPLETLVTLYSRVARSQKELGVSSGQLMTFTDSVATLLRVGGTSAEEASGALLQLSQALGGGVVRAEEFNSILEGAPTIAQAAAIGIKEAGGSVAQLRKLMLDGRLSSRAFFDAVNVGAPVMAKQLEGSSSTIGQSMTRLNNAFTDLATRFNESTEAGRAMSAVVDMVVDTLNGIDVAQAVKTLEGITGALEGIVTAFNNASISAKDWALRISEINDSGGVVDSLIRKLPDWLTTPNSILHIESAQMRRERQEQDTSDTMNARFGGSLSDRGGRVRPGGIPQAEVRLGKIVVPADAVSVDDYEVEGEAGKKKRERLASAPYLTARGFTGATEGRDANILSSFFKQANVNIDPRMTAWCAAFVNAALAANGLPGTGSLAARSFMNYGEATNDPRRGDIVVLSRGNNAAQGHVGFFEGYDEKGNVRVLGGNQSNGVNTQTYDRDRVLGFRSIPGAEREGLTEGLTAELERRREVTQAALEQDQSYRQILATGAEYIVQLQTEAQQRTLTAEQAAAQRYEQDLLNQAQQAGIELSDEQREQLSLLAQGMADAEVASQRLAETQAILSDLAEGAFKGFAQDLLAGKSAAEAFENVLGRIADKLLDMAFDGLLQSLFGGLGGGGRSPLASSAISKGVGGLFSSGGYTGPGGVRQPAGIVHKGEVVWSQDDVARAGGVAAVEGMRLGRRGYAGGGAVAMPSLSAPSLTVVRTGGAPEINLNVVNNTGVQADARTERQPDGSMSVILDKAVAQKLSTRGTETNNALRQGFGARPRLASR
ncbi:TIGR02594 family protein [Aureimonas frigidaquae]|uniref:Tail component of prophage protein n=1 Tax=Aureimonas frigidaquae TaxID=424757 RepID=A0A0P0Z3T1_9HYPH|nr:TIGR02594 family protein [Aureimonas frigidaquae]BAT28738.1 tail component of prophage protein [Aureimonas frigidaquae]